MATKKKTTVKAAAATTATEEMKNVVITTYKPIFFWEGVMVVLGFGPAKNFAG